MLRAILLAVLAWAAASVSQAACGGRDLVPGLARDRPAAHAEIVGRAAAMPNGAGRFWLVERAGTPPSHLFGTFHSALAIRMVPAPVWAALDRARVVVLEMSPDEQEAIRHRIAVQPALAFDPAAPPLSKRIDGRVVAGVQAALAMRGLPGSLAEQMRPWMLFSTLSVPLCEARARAAGRLPLDMVMAGRAEAHGVPVRGLERFEDIMAAFDRIGGPTLLSLLAAPRRLPASEEDLFRTDLSLYAAGRTGAIAEFARWQGRGRRFDDPPGPGERLRAGLIDGRNAAWLARLDPELARGRAFVAVGALHLSGDRGLIELLRERGWTVTRLD